MKKRIAPLLMVFLVMLTIMSQTATAVNSRAVTGRPTLKISGTKAYCVGKYSSGNRNDKISMTITLKQGATVIDSWSASGTGSVVISETCTVTAKRTYTLVLSATVNGKVMDDVTVTATGT